MKRSNPQSMKSVVDSIRGLKCWYVSCGGCTIPTFQLALGRKVRREIPLTNPAQSKEYRQFQGEANLLVWCSWRLDEPKRPLTSSDDTAASIEKGLSELIGAHVEEFSLIPPAWDLTIQFSGGFVLRIFCDHVPGDPSFDGNWELWLPTTALFVGPGEAYDIEERENSSNGKKTARGKTESRRASRKIGQG